MKDQANKIQAVMNTLEELDIKATEANMSRLICCRKVLQEVRDELNRPEKDRGEPVAT